MLFGLFSSPMVNAEEDLAELAEESGINDIVDEIPSDAALFLEENGISPSDPDAVQKKVNELLKPAPKPKPTAASKIVAKAKAYAWAYGTPQKKWAYKTGAPLASYKTALKKYLNKSKKISQSDCGYFVTTCVRASGVSGTFLALRGNKEAFPPVPNTMKIVHKGKKVPANLLKAGDIIRYKKKSGSQHTLMYIGGGRIAEAGREIRFPVIRKDTKKYNAKNVKINTLQVIRAK